MNYSINIFLSLFLTTFWCLSSFSQSRGLDSGALPLDSIQLFIKDKSSLLQVPQDSFVIIQPGTYQRIAYKYNLRQELIDSLNKQVLILDQQRRLSDTIQQNLLGIVEAQEQAIFDYNQQINGLMTNADSLSLRLNDALRLSKDIDKKSKRRKTWQFFQIGIASLAAGLIGGIVLFD